MLIIDPNLHNPKINGVELIVNNRINPQLAISKEDILAGDGVVVEKFEDGTIKISVRKDGQDTESSNKFLGLYEIDFMNFLPSVLYKFLNPLFSGMTETVFYAVDHSVRRNTSEFKPAAAYTYY